MNVYIYQSWSEETLLRQSVLTMPEVVGDQAQDELADPSRQPKSRCRWTPDLNARENALKTETTWEIEIQLSVLNGSVSCPFAFIDHQLVY